VTSDIPRPSFLNKYKIDYVLLDNKFYSIFIFRSLTYLFNNTMMSSPPSPPQHESNEDTKEFKKRRRLLEKLLQQTIANTNTVISSGDGINTTTTASIITPEKKSAGRRAKGNGKSKAKKTKQQRVVPYNRSGGGGNIGESDQIETRHIHELDKGELISDKIAKKSRYNDPDNKHHNDGDLSSWLAAHYNAKNKTQEELQREVIDDLTKAIDMSLNVRTHINTKATNDTTSSGPSKKKKQPLQHSSSTSNNKPKTPIVNNDGDVIDKKLMEEFFLGDEDPIGEYGCTAREYAIFASLKEEESKRETDYRKDCRTYYKFKGNGNYNSNDYENPPSCTKKYCSQFLCEPTAGMRPCKRGKKCITYVMATLFPDSIEDCSPENAFICREFLTPIQLDQCKAAGKPLFPPRDCLLDNRLRTTYRFYDAIKRNVEPKELIQDHQNVVDEPDGYNIEHCIYPTASSKKWRGIVAPIVQFSLSNYVYATMDAKDHPSGTIKCIVEQNLDF
jgi:hypothetical protein